MFKNLEIPKELWPGDPRFGVGPSLMPVSHVEKLAQASPYLGTSHRKPGVVSVVAELQEGLKKYFGLPEGYEIVLGNGGATLFWEFLGLSLAEKGAFHFVCGEFSEKAYKSHKNIPWIKAEAETVPYGESIKAYHKEGFDLTCCVLNETSTGVMNTELPARKKGHLLCVDATSGAGQIKANFEDIDVYYFSPQKVFASEGGTWIAIMSPEAVEQAFRVSSDKTRFIPIALNLKTAIEYSRLHQTYNTPSLSSLFYLNEQIKAMNELGEDEVIRLAQEKADFIYSWAKEKEYLSCYVKDEGVRSISVATIDVDEKYPMTELTRRLRELGIVYDIEAYRKLERNQLRIALFHNVSLEDLKKLTQIISLAIEHS
ncbi:MAG TPA: aminotransferase class V-fold PLP-dependent enzyme [Bacteriovoracaceae bacterium]|nr:aminotransferase class V-fold PLP-dependent enzyme [Bacteriovoracaceae bacterium]